MECISQLDESAELSDDDPPMETKTRGHAQSNQWPATRMIFTFNPQALDFDKFSSPYSQKLISYHHIPTVYPVAPSKKSTKNLPLLQTGILNLLIGCSGRGKLLSNEFDFKKVASEQRWIWSRCLNGLVSAERFPPLFKSKRPMVFAWKKVVVVCLPGRRKCLSPLVEARITNQILTCLIGVFGPISQKVKPKGQTVSNTMCTNGLTSYVYQT